MKDYGVSVLEQYDAEVYSTRRIRGAVLCNTDQGMLLLAPTQAPQGRLPVLVALYHLLKENGFPMVDNLIANKEGVYVTQAEDGSSYVLKQWFQGKECDVRREAELLEGVRHLARLHLVMRLPDSGEERQQDRRIAETITEEYERHNRELRKVRTYVCRRSVKGQFETEFLRGFDTMYQWAQAALKRLEKAGYQQLYEAVREEHTFVHGDYNYHNLLFCPQGLAVTGFEHAHQDIQIEDFYYFLRKTMEKHRYDERLGERMLRAYDAVYPLNSERREYLAVRLAYPEKFWKTANIYYHSNKSWVSAKNVEKLQTAIAQTEEKKRFLANLFAFHL